MVNSDATKSLRISARSEPHHFPDKPRWVSLLSTHPTKLRGAGAREKLLRRRLRLGPREGALQIIPQLDLGAVLVHDHALLQHRERVVPGPVDHQARREARQHEGE